MTYIHDHFLAVVSTAAKRYLESSDRHLLLDWRKPMLGSCLVWLGWHLGNPCGALRISRTCDSLKNYTCSLQLSTLVKRLCGRGVGWSFNDEKPNPIEEGLSSIRVNAFHPSYAINHYPIFCSLRRLLTLEFTKAFSLLRHKWTEEPWMTSLRTECRQAARNTADGKSLGLLVVITFSILAKSCCTVKDDRNVWSEQYLKARWESLLASLETSFEKCFFGGTGDIGSEETYINLANSDISWLCCDIAWILEELSPDGYERSELPSRCLHVFEAWCQKAWPKAKFQHNLSGSGGYYSHLELLLITSNQPDSLSKRLENRFYSLLRDLNLSYKWSRSVRLADTYDAFPNQFAQGCAFRRFAAAFEDSLEHFLVHKLSQKKPRFRQQFGSLSLNWNTKWLRSTKS